MKRIAIYLGIATALVASCSVQEEDFVTLRQDDTVFYASFEECAGDTRVYADEDLNLRWTSSDRVSIFNKLTYNQQYQFTGRDGANAGGFKKVDSDDFVTGNVLPHVVSVYPYRAGTKISENEVLTLTLPAEQYYGWRSFGSEANTMVAVSDNNFLPFKNVCGYLRLTLYGEDIAVSSITIKGNNGEKLAGKATVAISQDGIPTVTLANDAVDEVTLISDDPIWLSEWNRDFWFVLPPVTFSKGITVTVTQATGGVFEKSTSNSITVERSSLTKMAAVEVEYSVAPDQVIYYTTQDGEEVSINWWDAFGAHIISNTYKNGRGSIVFDGKVTCIGDGAFMDCSNLTSLEMPNSVTSIGSDAFSGTGLTSIGIPNSVTSIGPYAFSGTGLTSIDIPDSVTSIGSGAFLGCLSLTSVVIPKSVTSIMEDPGDYDKSTPFEGCEALASIVVESGNPIYDSRNNCNAIIKTETNELMVGCKNTMIPESVTSIGDLAFASCVGLLSMEIPNSVVSIGAYAFSDCNGLTSISLPNSLTHIREYAFSNCYGMTSIALPNSLTHIGEYAFSDCYGLASIDIPASVTGIDTNAFAFCTHLRDITVHATTPPILGNKGVWNTNNCPIYAPEESVDSYKEAPYWGNYASRIQAIPSNPVPVPVPVPEAVDLGLSVKWASFNLGASAPEEYGNYYAWGEVLTKSTFYWTNYLWCRGSGGSDVYIVKYSREDSKTVLELSDDAARANLGGNWRMPTDSELNELRTQCTWKWTTQNGQKGYNVKGRNGNSIFLPAAGSNNGYNSNSNGYYYSSSLYVSNDGQSQYLFFTSSKVNKTNGYRYTGYSIRPVCE